MTTTDYGTDVATFAAVGCDLDPTFGLISGPRVVLEQVARGQIGPLRDALRASITDDQLRAVTQACERAANDDERVLSAETTVAFDFATETLEATTQLELVEGETFTLVLQINAVTTDLLLGTT